MYVLIGHEVLSGYLGQAFSLTDVAGGQATLEGLLGIFPHLDVEEETYNAYESLEPCSLADRRCKDPRSVAKRAMSPIVVVVIIHYHGGGVLVREQELRRRVLACRISLMSGNACLPPRLKD